MKIFKPQNSTLILWQVRLALCCLIPSIIIGWSFPTLSPMWIFFSCLWIAVFIFFYGIYFPLKYKKLSYKIDHGMFIVYGGVFYTVTKSVPLANIQFITKMASPLERFFHICSFRIIGAGSSIMVRGLKEDSLDCLYTYIEEGGNE